MKKLLISLFLLFSPLSLRALTVSVLRSNIRTIIKDAGDHNRYQDAQLLDLLNEGQRDVSNLTWLVSNSTSFSLVSGTTYYSLPTDIVEITRVTREYKLLNETTFSKADSDSAGSSWETLGGIPIDYFQDSTQPDKIGIKPFPNNSSSTGTIRVQYISQPTELVLSSDIPFNGSSRYLIYNDILVYYAVTRIFMLEGDIQRSQVYSQLYESRIDALKQKAGSHPNFLPSFSGTRTGK